MPETKKEIDLFGNKVPVSDVPAIESSEQFTQYRLEDGTVLKVKHVATSFLRVDGQFLPDGSPIYIVLSNPVASVISSPLAKKEIVAAKKAD